MPRHTFKYSREFLDKLRERIDSAFQAIEIDRFSQEPKYTSAILGRLHGEVVKSSSGEYAKFEATDLDDRGPNSAEKRYGADFVITATVGDSKKRIKKAIMVQVKKNPIDSLTKGELNKLKEQLKDMKKVVHSPKVAGIKQENGRGMFEISSGNKVLKGEPFSKTDFATYFNQRVITTLDGCTDQRIVDALQDSGLKKLDVMVKKEETIG